MPTQYPSDLTVAYFIINNIFINLLHFIYHEILHE